MFHINAAEGCEASVTAWLRANRKPVDKAVARSGENFSNTACGRKRGKPIRKPMQTR